MAFLFFSCNWCDKIWLSTKYMRKKGAQCNIKMLFRTELYKWMSLWRHTNSIIFSSHALSVCFLLAFNFPTTVSIHLISSNWKKACETYLHSMELSTALVTKIYVVFGNATFECIFTFECSCCRVFCSYCSCEKQMEKETKSYTWV